MKKKYFTEEARLSAIKKSKAKTNRRYRKKYTRMQRRYYRRNRTKLLASAKKRARGVWLKKKYGLTEADYERMLSDQKGQCFICGPNITSPHWMKHLCVDHDHATGKVRALICDRCNRLLGSVKENPLILKSAARYLERFKT